MTGLGTSESSRPSAARPGVDWHGASGFPQLKRRFIKDPIWGNVELFEWEKELLNHFLINRLHSIVQNSGAFRVYPGLKYSRFCHTVGVLHVATEIFVNVVLNSDEAGLSQLRSEAVRADRICEPPAKEMLHQTMPRFIRCVPDYAVLLAFTRVGALLHDIGHLPYSHVFERALHGFLLKHSVRDVTATGPVDGEATLRGLKEWYADASTRGQKLHELLGERFSRLFAEEFSSEPGRSVVRGAVALLHEGDWPAAKSILVGPMDADRIDFVRRDTTFSGLQDTAVDSGRLFACYELSEYGDGPEHRWGVRPNRRGTSEGEKLIWERFQDYKYIISHHKVHFFDEVLERLIIRLLEDGSLDSFLSDLHGLIFAEHPSTLNDRVKTVMLLKSILLKFDDPWLDVSLREAYVRAAERHDDSSKLFVRLFEGLSEKRDFFKTAFKRDEDFYGTYREIYPEILRPALRQAVVMSLQTLKYRIEAETHEKFGRIVVVGDRASKAQHGLQDEETAAFFGVGELQDFLTRKMRQAALFNVWVDSPINSEVGDCKDLLKFVAERTMNYVEEAVLKQPRLPITND